MTTLTEQTGLRRRARTAGVCYLLVIAGGLFTEGVVRGSLITPGDAAATASEIAGNETLWRWGLAVHLLYLVPAVAVNVLVSGLFRPLEPTLARLALVFGVTGVGIEAVSLLNLYLPLAMSEDGGTIGALGEGERQAMTYLATRMFSTGFGFALVLFAGFCVLIGSLILRTRLLPRAFGVLMLAAGVCYIVNTLALILSPRLSEVLMPGILLPILVAELAMAVRLVSKPPTGA